MRIAQKDAFGQDLTSSNKYSLDACDFIVLVMRWSVSSSSERLSSALGLHRAGQLPEAAAVYQQILSVEPQHADALHLLGVLANQLGKAELAVDLISRSIAISPRVTEYHNNLGNAHKARGSRNEAEKSYREAIALNPHNADAFTNLGALLEQQGRLEEAKASYQSATRAAPNMSLAQLSLGNLIVAAGNYKLGIKHLKKAISASPQHAPAHNALGNALFRLGENALAESSYRRALQIDPSNSDARFNLGNVYLSEKNYSGAIDVYKQVIALPAPQSDVYSNLGVAYLESEQLPPAMEAFVRAIELAPSNAEAHFNLGRLLAKQKDHHRAIESFDRAIELDPDYAKAFHSLGSSRQALGELAAAKAAYHRALDIEPEYTAVISNLASVLVLQGSQEGADWFEKLVEQEPASAVAHWNLSTALLMLGDYIRGWKEYEWRWQWEGFTSPKRGFEQPQWNGEPLEGATILLHAEQGFGDTLQFIRYAPLVAQRGGRVVLEVQPGLKRLLQRLPGIAECVEAGEPLPEFNYHCPMMSLAAVFGTTIETVPPVPSGFLGHTGLISSQTKVNHDCLKVGLVWAGNPKHQNDALRSISLAELLPLAKIDVVSFVSLQKGPASAQTAEGHWPVKLPDLLSEAIDFAETAAIVTNLDLVITVDTAMAHLVGTMEKPVWILHSHIPDWRWGLQSETTPWYPTARLFRKSASAGWGGLIEHVASELTILRDSYI